MTDLIFVGQFIASKTGKTGLSPTVDVDRYTISDGSRTALITGGSATEGRRGLYHYRLASADLSLYQYVATFSTVDSSVDQQDVAAIGIVVPDALVSSRAAIGEAPTEAEIVAAIDANSTRLADILEDTGTTVPAVLAVVDANVDAIKLKTDALDTSAVTITTTNDAGEITIKRSASFAATVSGLSIPADWLAVIWTVKGAASDDDDDAVLQVRASNPTAPTDGLLVIESNAPDVSLSASSGSVTVDQPGRSVALALKAAATTVLAARGDVVWDLRVLRPPAGEADELTTGTADIVYTVTHTRT